MYQARSGHTLNQVKLMAIWLSANRNKTAYFATALNSKHITKIFKYYYPHLVLRLDNFGIIVKFPACDR